MNNSPASVLFVDPHRDTLSMLAVLFSEYKTEAVTCASDAVSVARDRHFDLYLVENHLPGESGVELCNSLRTVDPDGKVVFFSSDGSISDKTKALAAGAIDYITKPNVDELIETVQTVLSDPNDFTH